MTVLLEQDPRVEIVPPERDREAQVILALAFEVDDALMSRIKAALLEARMPGVRMVIVAESMTQAHRAWARAHGLTHLLHRGNVRGETVVQALLDRGRGWAGRPPAREGAAAHTSGARPAGPVREGRAPAGHPRELDVLRLLADGFSTAEISARLNYSQRTIKSIIQRMLERRGLRNRPHAVAYALRRNLL
ncbi:response regulator transcription factor [Streptomyces sp. NPDC048297]|uniref:helix-turn-helix transcriptional regulator n=1 Tax=Streptomyces sp. NPDC048297 TaxID=3365531 RepID=UPI003718505D